MNIVPSSSIVFRLTASLGPFFVILLLVIGHNNLVVHKQGKIILGPCFMPRNGRGGLSNQIIRQGVNIAIHVLHGRRQGRVRVVLDIDNADIVPIIAVPKPVPSHHVAAAQQIHGKMLIKGPAIGLGGCVKTGAALVSNIVLRFRILRLAVPFRHEQRSGMIGMHRGPVGNLGLFRRPPHVIIDRTNVHVRGRTVPGAKLSRDATVKARSQKQVMGIDRFQGRVNAAVVFLHDQQRKGGIVRLLDLIRRVNLVLRHEAPRRPMPRILLGQFQIPRQEVLFVKGQFIVRKVSQQPRIVPHLGRHVRLSV
mmetsp:Transcript_5199/g.14596  ORF Transcript_5199/g.14596 Transcript_5199/m.14596 type:complete len:308 (+) Transcript_5199:511-1434(+)